jgi:hypothetical protein
MVEHGEGGHQAAILASDAARSDSVGCHPGLETSIMAAMQRIIGYRFRYDGVPPA